MSGDPSRAIGTREHRIENDSGWADTSMLRSSTFEARANVLEVSHLKTGGKYRDRVDSRTQLWKKPSKKTHWHHNPPGSDRVSEISHTQVPDEGSKPAFLSVSAPRSVLSFMVSRGSSYLCKTPQVTRQQHEYAMSSVDA